MQFYASPDFLNASKVFKNITVEPKIQNIFQIALFFQASKSFSVGNSNVKSHVFSKIKAGIS